MPVALGVSRTVLGGGTAAFFVVLASAVGSTSAASSTTAYASAAASAATSDSAVASAAGINLVYSASSRSAPGQDPHGYEHVNLLSLDEEIIYIPQGM